MLLGALVITKGLGMDAAKVVASPVVVDEAEVLGASAY
jgi:hypothetical protein